MKADVAFPALLTSARALKPYIGGRGHLRAVDLHTHDRTLTLTADGRHGIAQVDLPGGTADGRCAIAVDALSAALRTLRPSGAAAKTATVTLSTEPGRLQVAVGDRLPIVLDADTGSGAGPDPSACVTPTGTATTVTTGPVADWCDLVSKVGWAAGTDPRLPDLRVVRLLRDFAGTVLVVEAHDRYRVHRGCWGAPGGAPVDAQLPLDAANRAVALFTTCDPEATLSVEADPAYLWWHTDRVRIRMRTDAAAHLDLEQLREQVCGSIDLRFTAERARLLAAVETAEALAATTRRGQLDIAFTGAAVDVGVYADSGTLLHHSTVPVTAAAGPARTLRFTPRLLRQAVAFLDADTVHIAASVDQLGVYLESGDRHAIVLRRAA